jgi:hypothetical protein
MEECLNTFLEKELEPNEYVDQVHQSITHSSKGGGDYLVITIWIKQMEIDPQ